MKIEFAPLNIPLRRRLQTAAVLQWIFSFLGLAQCCLAAFVLLALSDWWTLALLYAGWLWLDWDTPVSGGRRCQWVRTWRLWDFFPGQNRRPGPREELHLRVPPTWELLHGGHGLLPPLPRTQAPPADAALLVPGPPLQGLHHVWRSGVQLQVQPVPPHQSSPGWKRCRHRCGRTQKSLDARPGALKLQVLHRKGFIKLALKHGAQLVPVFSFGENELFDQMQNPSGSPLRRLQDRLQSLMGIAMPLFHARGVFQYSFGLMPYRKPVHTVVGKPISVAQTPSPTSEDIEALHRAYLQRLTQLFEEHKLEYGLQQHQHL
ncbi:unnamed protein product, partial [Tetraodon nigroviridis]